MKRLFVNSEVVILPTNAENIVSSLSKIKYIIQLEKLEEELYFVEHCNQDEVVDLIPFDTVVNSGQKPARKPESESDKIAEYRAVVLNKDPFGKYSGKTLGEIIDANDEQWLDKVVKTMKNDYIRQRIEFLQKHNTEQPVEDDGLPF